MDFPDKLKEVQKYLFEKRLDGWLLYDFRNQNDLATRFLEIPDSKMLTRRFFYWIPAKGEPQKLVHAIEADNLSHLPGKQILYSTWQKLEEILKKALSGKEIILMEYSKNNAVPYLSKVDGGTLELVKGCGVEVESSGTLLQRYTSVWSKDQYADHVEAASVLSKAVEDAWRFIGEKLKNQEQVNEYQVQQKILEVIKSCGCQTEEPPIVAVNAHSADPHYLPCSDRWNPIKRGDFLLIDLYCRKNKERAPYADITRVAVAASKPQEKHREVFEIVRRAQAAALELVRQRFQEKKKLMGREVDRVCRTLIDAGGYGQYFIHRTGHNLDVQLHGPGANLDDFETRDERELLPGTCFTIEPGIYLPGEFGIRLEYDVFVHLDGEVVVNGGMQNEIACLL